MQITNHKCYCRQEFLRTNVLFLSLTYDCKFFNGMSRFLMVQFSALQCENSAITFPWVRSSQSWLVPLRGLTTQILCLALVFEMLRKILHACLKNVLMWMLVKCQVIRIRFSSGVGLWLYQVERAVVKEFCWSDRPLASRWNF